MSADTIAKLSQACAFDKINFLPEMVRFCAEHEHGFGYGAALHKFGRRFEHVA